MSPDARTSGRETATQILEGLRVVELSRGWSAVALCGTMLAELGADIVTIETAEQRRESSADDILAAGKQTKRIDLAKDARQSELEALIASADVVLDDRSYTRSLGIDGVLDQAASRNARLVFCTITAFGRSGPLGDVAGSELIAQAMSGAMSTTGFPGDPPTMVGVPVGEHSASLYAGYGILSALYRRLRTGQGDTLDISVHDCLLTYLATFLPAHCESGNDPGRIGNLHPMVAPWNSYRASDGWVIICVGADKQWSALAQLIGGDALAADDAYRTRALRLCQRDRIDATVSAWARSRTVAEIVASLDALEIPAGPIQTIADLVRDPQFDARQLIVRDAEDATASIRCMGSLFKMSRTPGRGLAFARPSAVRGKSEAVEVASGRRITRETPAADDGPLAGVRVLECGAYTAGPLCARLLADLGAEVIKVEPHGGDPVRELGGRLDDMSHIFHILNYGKKSVTVDARSDDGRATLLALCAQSDVLLENLAPGVLAKWGLDVATLHIRNPRLVYCSINGYGWNGPMGAKRAFDTVVQARAGILSQTGYADGPPTKMGASLADVACAVLGAFAIAAALYHQRHAGVGQFVDVAMFDVLARMSARPCIDYLNDRTLEGRRGNASRFHAPHDLYRTSDGLVAIAVVDDGQWQRLRHLMEADGCELPGRLATQRDRLDQVEALDLTINAWAGGFDADTLVLRCHAAGVPAGKVLDIGDIVRHPHVRDRDMLPPVQIGERRVPVLGSPVKLASARKPRHVVPAPKLGAHNRELIGAI